MKLFVPLLLCFLTLRAADLDDAIAALQRRDFVSAEQKLRTFSAAHPNDAFALSLLGAALDSQNKSTEAENFHRRAVGLSPRSTDVLNNYAVHLWIAGKQIEARDIYKRIVAIDPANIAANLQLAQLALKDGKGTEALGYITRLPENPQTLLLRLNALYLNGNQTEGDALATRVTGMARGNQEMTIALATALWSAHRFDKAELAFEDALKGDPANFSILYDLGVAATQAGHAARSAEVLQTALRQQPENLDVLVALAQADAALQRFEPALQLLAQAARLNPKRPDVQKLIAIVASELGALDDSLSAWDRYLKLAPSDGVAKRERAYTLAKTGNLTDAMPIVEAAVARLPDDATGHYELGQMQRGLDAAKALAQFDKALALDPKNVPALTARGSLRYQEGNPASALGDLELAASLAPEAANLDRLGQTYQALDKTADALRVLRQAANLAPSDSKILLHLGRALADAGNTEESKTVMDRFRQLGPEKKGGVPPGFVEYLSLTPEQRRASYRARVEKAAADHPADASVQLAWLKVLLEERRVVQAREVAGRIAALKPAAPVLAEAELNLAVAILRSGRPDDALSELDHVPGALRNGDYLMARAEALSALDRRDESKSEMDRALASASDRPDLYRRAAGLLIRQGDRAGATNLLARAPADKSVLLMKAALSENSATFVEIQNRWPEWYPGWAAQGMILADQEHYADALKPLQTAAALGAGEPEIYFYLAVCQMKQGLSAQTAVARAVALSGEHPDQWIQALSHGRIEKPPYFTRLLEGSIF